MANEFKHGSVGTELTQAEWEGVGTHVLASQATGAIVYASSTTQLSRLGKGADNTVLHLASGIPAWSATLAGLTLTTPTISSTGFANANHAHAASNSGGTIAASALSGTSLASGVVTTSATTVGALNSGSITSGFGNIDVGGSSIAAGSFDASDGNITNVGDIALDTISADGTNVTINGPIDVQAGYANGGGAPYDGVVDVGGGGNWTTIQAGDDDLDGGTYTMLVKSGTYSGGFTVSTNEAKIVVEPGTVIQAAITLSGNDITLVLGAGGDIQGLITMSGDNCSLLCENGVDLDGITSSGDYNTIDGGGWDTISYVSSGQSAISLSWSTGTVVQNIAAQEPTSNTYSAITLAGTKHRAINCRAIESGGSGIVVSATSNENYVAHCRVDNCDEASYLSNGPRNVFVGNIGFNAGTMGFQISDTGDDTVVIGNIIEGQAGDSVDINATGENCLVVGNRLDGAVDDNSGTSTVANNEVTAF